jgi:hypothetical protein
MADLTATMANDIARGLSMPMRLALKRLQRVAPDRERALQYHDLIRSTADALIDRDLAAWGRDGSGEYIIWITELGLQVAQQIGTLGNLIAPSPNRHLPKGT